MSDKSVVPVIDGAIMEKLVIGGDLAALTPAQKVSYYKTVCDSLGLNPLTKPFDVLRLNGLEVLYAKRDATDQLRRIYGVSVTDLESRIVEGVCIVTVKGRDAAGRTDASTGAVTVQGLKGDSLANALMKAETKAKRRLTLSLCGLGMLDETEVETIPAPAEETRTVRQAEKTAEQQLYLSILDALKKLKDGGIVTATNATLWKREMNAAYALGGEAAMAALGGIRVRLEAFAQQAVDAAPTTNAIAQEEAL